MRQYEGIANIGRIKTIADLQDAIFRMDRMLRQLSSVVGAIGPGQFPGGATGSGSVGGGSVGTEYSDGQAVAVPKGPAILGWDGTNVQVITTDADGNPQIDVLTLPAITGSVTADTELPAAVAHADNLTLANAPNVIAAGYARDEGATTHSRVSGELSSVDTEAGNDGDFGQHVSDVAKNYKVDLTALNDTYDTTSTQTNTSAAVDVRRFRTAEFQFDLVSSGSPTDIRFSALFADESGGTYMVHMKGAWCNLLFDDTICTSTIYRGYPLDLEGVHYLKIEAYATGLATGSKSFTISDAKILLKN